MARTSEDIKLRDEKILSFLKTYIDIHGYAPSLRNICAELGINSTSMIHSSLKRLEKAGIIKRDKNVTRGIIINKNDNLISNTSDTSKASKFSEAKPETKDNLENQFSSKETDFKEQYTPRESYFNRNMEIFKENVNVPIVGTVAAGSPILAEENIEDYFNLPSEFVRGTNYMLKVKGESMIDAGIMDGDLILVQKQNTAQNGDIVVALLDNLEGEATVKTFYKEKNHIRLQPENPNMEPIIAKAVTILGKVKGVFRYYS